MARKRLDIAGQTFGRWKAIKFVGRSNTGGTLWECQCQCGTVRAVPYGNLKSGQSTSCGCQRTERIVASAPYRKKPSGRLIDLSGQKFNNWTVLRRAQSVSGNTAWHCECQCGTTAIVFANNLVSGKSKSCGCLQKEAVIRTRTKHGLTDHPLYGTWSEMKKRCYDVGSVNYSDYGGRGIKICERWLSGFEFFWDDMFPTWKPGLSIDRIDTNGDYEPKNCRWATQKQQVDNRRSTIFVDTPWGWIPRAEAARHLGIANTPLMYRMKNWPKERWFEPPNSGNRKKST